MGIPIDRSPDGYYLLFRSSRFKPPMDDCEVSNLVRRIKPNCFRGELQKTLRTEVNTEIIEIRNIDTVQESFVAQLRITAKWKVTQEEQLLYLMDPNNSCPEVAPTIDIFNARNIEVLDQGDPIVVSERGLIHGQRTIRVTAEFNEDFELEAFPFDCQVRPQHACQAHHAVIHIYFQAEANAAMLTCKVDSLVADSQTHFRQTGSPTCLEFYANLARARSTRITDLDMECMSLPLFSNRFYRLLHASISGVPAVTVVLLHCAA